MYHTLWMDALLPTTHFLNFKLHYMHTVYYIVYALHFSYFSYFTHTIPIQWCTYTNAKTVTTYIILHHYNYFKTVNKMSTFSKYTQI